MNHLRSQHVLAASALLRSVTWSRAGAPRQSEPLYFFSFKIVLGWLNATALLSSALNVCQFMLTATYWNAHRLWKWHRVSWISLIHCIVFLHMFCLIDSNNISFCVLQDVIIAGAVTFCRALPTCCRVILAPIFDSIWRFMLVPILLRNDDLNVVTLVSQNPERVHLSW